MIPAASVKTLVIDGTDVSARSDQTILEAAREHGLAIPTLCHLDGLSDVGACRLCLVEVKGANRLLPACVTLVEEGMDVTSNSERLAKYRRMILELLFAERNHVCSVCVVNGHCDLQSLAQAQGMTHVHFPYRYPKLDIDASHERFVVDDNRCILCTRCVRVCDEVEGAIPGTSWDEVSTPRSSPICASLGGRPRRVRVAESAYKSAPPAPYSRRVSQVPRQRRSGTSCRTFP